MARPKSVILSKDEKKAVVADLKTKIKSAKENLKLVGTTFKDAGKIYAAAVKEHDKASAAATKELASLEAQLAALTEKSSA